MDARGQRREKEKVWENDRREKSKDSVKSKQMKNLEEFRENKCYYIISSISI